MTITDTIVPTIPTANGPRTMGAVAITKHDPILATLDGCDFLADTAREFGWVDAQWGPVRTLFLHHRCSDTVTAHDVMNDLDRDIFISAEAVEHARYRVAAMRQATLSSPTDSPTEHYWSGMLDGAEQDLADALGEQALLHLDREGLA